MKPWQTAVQGATGIVGSLIQSRAAKQAQAAQNEANKELAAYSYSKDLEMWNRQNAYNNPQSQMERFSDAGLNPNLIYGKGTAGNATTLPKYQTPTASIKSFMPSLGDELSRFSNLRLQQAQTKVQENQARLLDEKATTESVNRALVSSRAEDFANKNRYWWSTNKFFGYPGETRYSTFKDIQGNTAQQRWNQSKQANQLAKFNWQIAEQNLMLRQKDNMYYMWKNLYGPLGGSVIRGAGNAFKFLRGGKKIGSSLRTPKMPSKFGPRGYTGKGNISVNDWYGYQRNFSGF